MVISEAEASAVSRVAGFTLMCLSIRIVSVVPAGMLTLTGTAETTCPAGTGSGCPRLERCHRTRT